MKKAIAILLTIALTLLMTVPALAVTGSIGKYTPAIDGDKDEAYSQSFSFNIFEQDNANRGEGWWSTHGVEATNADANIWFLWDDSFLYAYVEVLLSEVLDIGKDYITDSDNPWESNSVELWVLWGDLDEAGDRVKTSVEPLYGRTWGDGPYFDDIEPNTQKSAKLTATGYSAEFAVAIPPAFLKEGGQVRFTLQVNVYDGEGSIPVGQQIGGGQHDVDLAPLLTFGAPIVIAAPEPEPEPEPEAPAAVEEAPVVAAPAPVPVAPRTSDSASAIVVLLTLAACAFAVTKRVAKVK